MNTPSHSFQLLLRVLLALATLPAARAQVQSGSTGADGDLVVATSRVIDMNEKPDGVYHYKSVTIRQGAAVTFKPNAKNTPVVWLIQRSLTMERDSDVSVSPVSLSVVPGPGGFRGGNGGTTPTRGGGPGGGGINSGAGYRTAGAIGDVPGRPYGNQFVLPLVGGSGGGGSSRGQGGAGAGAILVVANDFVRVDGSIGALGGSGNAGGGSGGAIRIVSSRIEGTGVLSARSYYGGGEGWVRVDAIDNQWHGNLDPTGTIGYQPIISLPTNPFTIEIASVAGVPISLPTSANLANPDAILSSLIKPPVPVVVRCLGLPLNSEITVTAYPSFGSPVTASGFNNEGTVGSSTATINLNLPRGVGTMQAKTSRAIAASVEGLEAGLIATGEKFQTVEATASPGTPSQYRYTTDKGTSYVVPAQP